MPNDPLTGNRISSVRYERIKVSSRDVYGWVAQAPISSTVDEDFEDASYNITFSVTGTGSSVRSTVDPHTGSYCYFLSTDPGTLSMDITVPANATTFSYWYRSRGPNTLVHTLLLDGVQVFSTGSIVGGSYVQKTGVNVTGVTTVTIRSTGGAGGGFSGNLDLDDLHFDISTPVYQWTLLYTVQEEASAGNLDGVIGGSLDFVANASIKGGGSITIVDNGQNINFLNDRVKVYYTVGGYGETPLGVFNFSEAPESWSDTGRTYAVKLLDKNSIFDQNAVSVTTALDTGTVVTTQVVTYLGNENQAITPSAATLAGPQTWDPGTSYLKIINDLLATIGYFSLITNGDGQFQGKPYVLPANRPITWRFLDGDNCIYVPEFTNDVDLFSIPNRFIAVGQGSGATAALTSTYTNTDPTSPYSTVSRGRTIVAVQTGVEAADQTTLDNYARRRLNELTSPTQSITIKHAYVPGLKVNDAVWFRSQTAGIDARHVVTKTVINLDPTALCVTTLQKVVAL